MVQVGTQSFQLQTQTPTQGCYNPLKNVLFTDNAYGPVHAVIWWEKGYEEPLYLITNMADPIRVANRYKKRFRVETFFSDTKSRGFTPADNFLNDDEDFPDDFHLWEF